MHHLLIIQFLLILLVASYFVAQPAMVLAALYGGAIALLNSLLLGLKVNKIQQNQQSAKKDVAVLYIGAIQRFVLTFVAMIVGMGSLALNPIPLLVTFGLAQAACFLTPLLQANINSRLRSNYEQ